MAGKNKKRRKRTGNSAKKVSWKKRFLKLAAALLLLLMMVMLAQGSVVKVTCTDVPIKGLPRALDGTKIIYISDIHVTGVNSQTKLKSLFDRLQQLEPDLLLLGGDYTGIDLFSMAASMGSKREYQARMIDQRDLFFLNLRDFQAPLGKFGVAGDMDNRLEEGEPSTLAQAMALGNVTLLRDDSFSVVKNGERLTIVGVDDWRTGPQDTTSPVKGVYSQDCVILLCHNPEGLPQLNNRLAEDGGLWADLALTGHTMGGLIKIGDYELLNTLREKERFSAGWHLENATKTLVSEGLSGSVLPLRLGTWAQVHLITLRCEEEE